MSQKILSVVCCLVLSTFIFSACGYKSIEHGKEITAEEASKIFDNKTTKNEIFMKFGEPTKVMDDEKVFFYSWTRGGKGHVLGFGSGSAESNALVIVFNERDVVISHKITRGATTGGATTID